jgi:hypothetical protein
MMPTNRMLADGTHFPEGKDEDGSEYIDPDSKWQE